MDSRLQRRLGRLLRDARVEASLSQWNVADALRTSQTFVSKYELGQRRISVIELLEICQVLKADPASLVRKLRSTQPLRH